MVVRTDAPPFADMDVSGIGERTRPRSHNNVDEESRLPALRAPLLEGGALSPFSCSSNPWRRVMAELCARPSSSFLLRFFGTCFFRLTVHDYIQITVCVASRPRCSTTVLVQEIAPGSSCNSAKCLAPAVHFLSMQLEWEVNVGNTCDPSSQLREKH